MTTPTTNPVPSSAAADLLFNAEKIDEAVSTAALTYTDRLGASRLTLAGATARISAINTRGAWVTATVYAARDVVSNSGTWYIALDAHTSGATFAGDSAAHWRVYQGVTQSQLDTQLEGYVAGEAGRACRELACVVRNSGAGWVFINDTDHAPMGFSAVSVVGDTLRVTYSATYTKVLSMLGSVDETMASRGLSFGPSVGLGLSNFSLFMNFSCWVEKALGTFAFGDIDPWLDPGVDTTIATTDESRFTITHKTASGDDPPMATLITGTAGIEPRLSYGGTSIIVTFFDDLAGYVYYNAGTTSWVVVTNNIAQPTFSFAAGVLTVTHEDIGDCYEVFITPVSGLYVMAAGTPSGTAGTRATSFTVGIYDYAGAAVTTANANMKFHYRRTRKVRTKAPDGTRVSIRRGPVLLDPAAVISTDGNLWIRAVMEV